jgi:membrane-associated phospholipid phosphatase
VEQKQRLIQDLVRDMNAPHAALMVLLFAVSSTAMASDVSQLATAPFHWKARQWAHFAEGTAAVAALYAADTRIYDSVQDHRSSATDHFAREITPFGGNRALEISALLFVGGAISHEQQVRSAGRDSLEAELWAAGVVTPLLKRAFGRARPLQEEGARSFHPFSSGYESLPSGHATNVFAFATAVAAHADGWIVPVLVYTMATGVAMSRVNDRAHFPSDVLAGALIGRAVAKGITARHRRFAPAVTPAIINRRPALVLTISTRYS